MRRLPSLNQLRAFEAAARHGSFKAAADELCVTQAAISHQIKRLEEDLQETLFARGVREVRVLERAAPLADQLTRSLDEVVAAVEDFRGATLTGRLRLSVAPFFGNRWLLPRLERFHARHPGLRVDPVFSFDLVDIAAAAPGRNITFETINFESRAYAFDAALSGQAVALFDTRMTAADERNEQLVLLHPMTVERPQGIHVVFPKCARPDARIKKFAAWLHEEANPSEAECP